MVGLARVILEAVPAAFVILIYDGVPTLGVTKVRLVTVPVALVKLI